MEEYRIRVTVRNNLILQAINAEGYTNLAKFAKDKGISLSVLYRLINLVESPIAKSGDFSKNAKELMEVLGACPTDLWTAEQLNMKLKSNKVEKAISKEALIAALGVSSRELVTFETPFEQVSQAEDAQVIGEILETLTPSEERILKMRFGMDGNGGMTLQETGKQVGLTQERIRQIEARALRKIRMTPLRRDTLRDMLDE